MADDDDIYDDNTTIADNNDDLEDDDQIANDDSPFSEPDDASRHLPIDHPQSDTNIDPHELYDEGLDGATDVDLPGNDYQ